ncbi:MAG: hypothetical protein AB1698_03480 [Pseudomonadota bacterium]
MGRDFGGEMRLRGGDGAALTMRAGFTLGSSGVSIEPVTNQDGSVSRTATLKGRTAEVTLEDSNADVNALMRAPRQNIYITEDWTGIGHVFTNAFFSGDAAIDRATGEWTGLTITAEGYQRLGG